ncbi:MAG: glycosyltransferase family 2 protein [Ferruginibacter sp.]
MKNISGSIIIVNYKTANLLLDCLASLCRYAHDNLEILVVDNLSGDEAEVWLAEHYPFVKFIQTGYNAGFARANNIGIRQAVGEIILLLNSDTIIHENAIQECMHRLSQAPEIAAGVQLLNTDGSPQISGNYIITGGLNYLLPLPVMGKFFKWLAGLVGVKKTHVPEALNKVNVDWINGAFFMVKKSAIEKAGLLDEDFFLYFEEAEWCSRLKKQGSLCIYGDLHVTHLQGESANEAFGSAGKGYFNLADKKGYQIMLSCFLRMKKEFGTGWMLFLLLFYVLNIPVYLLAAFFKNFIAKPGEQPLTHWKGYTQNVFKVLRWVPRIISGRSYFYKIL